MIDWLQQRKACRAGVGALVLACALQGAAAVSDLGVRPASAQLFDFFPRPPGSIPGGSPPRPRSQQRSFDFPFFGGGGNSNYDDHWSRPREPRRAAPQPVQGDFSKAPPPMRRDVEAATNVVVLGDSMADWLGSGLEDAFSDSPEIGVTRKVRTGSGLIRSEGREGYDWVQGAKDSLTNEKPDFVVMMIGLGDRHPIRERQAPRPTQPPAQKPNEPPKPGDTANPAEAAKPADPARSREALDTGDAIPADQPAGAAPEAVRPAAVVTHEFRSEKWIELYSKRVDDAIAAMKAKRVPVLWVGLPPVRGPRSRTDLSLLNELYKARAEKAGITYVDVWDGFMDESGDFSTYGPDVIGQVRRLRAADGVHFTKAGARKLAHYVEREIRRLLTRATPVALPAPEEPQRPSAPAQPSGPAPRPVAGPVVPLTGHTPAGEGLLGSGSQPGTVSDPVASRVLVRGEPLAAPEGRADNFAWPRGEAAADQIEPPDPLATTRPAAPATRAAPRPGQRPAPQAAPAPTRPAR